MRILKLVSFIGAACTISVAANAQFSVTGGGGAIPASGTGGGGTWDSAQPPSESNWGVTVPANVTAITSIDCDGLSHTWMGDLQMTLCDPNGVEHLVFVRPGFQNTSNFGNSGDFTGGLYTFVESGGDDLPTSSSAGDSPGGTYNQMFHTGGTPWNSGTNGINNTPLGSVTGPQGDWCLKTYDWGGGDSGSCNEWTLNGESGGGECYLAMGDGPGNAGFTPEENTLTTQLNQVNDYYAVLQNSMPEFVIPTGGAPTFGGGGIMGNVGATRSAYTTYAVEVVMYNPEIFPNDPEHHTNGLLVYIDGHGNLLQVPYGNGDMSVWAQVGTNFSGERVVKFPFTMPE